MVKKEDLRPIRYNVVEDAARPVWNNGWFHRWFERDGYMRGLIETKDGVMLNFSSAHIEFTDRKNDN